MRTSYGLAGKFQPAEMHSLYAYRHAVFIQRLGWDLPGAKQGLEMDQFDRPDTIHVLRRKSDGTLCGCARLLPTSRPYLLGEIFPELMHGAPIPSSSDVWEISRFCSVDVNSRTTSRQAKQVTVWGCRDVLAATVTCAIEVGAKRLIAVSSIAIERILLRLGVHANRVGPPMRIGGHTIFAFWLEIDEQTIAALGLRD